MAAFVVVLCGVNKGGLVGVVGKNSGYQIPRSILPGSAKIGSFV